MTVNLPSSTSYCFDANGNLTSDAHNTYAYDDENQLILITATNSWSTEFVYDGKMRMRVRYESNWVSSAWAKLSETRYIYDGMLLVQERDGNNVPTVTYTRGLDLSGSLQGAGGIGGLVCRTDMGLFTAGVSGAHNFYHSDGNGNVTALVNDHQVLSAKYSYDPFGNTLSQSGPLADANRLRFSSKECFQNSGLYYYGYRFYNPNFQRWLNRDPLAERFDPNLYRFNYNSPTKYFDPNGLWGVQFGNFNIGWGAPNLAFDSHSLADVAQGAAATADGLIPFFDPFKNHYDQCDKTLQASKALGKVAQVALTTAGRTGCHEST